MTKLDKGQMEYLCRAIASLRRGSGFIGEGVKRSELMEYFMSIIGGEQGMEATESAVEIEMAAAAAAEREDVSANVGDRDLATEETAGNYAAVKFLMENAVALSKDFPSRDATKR
mmetsp:Transcript_41268/g.87946  ORF Transcript_41268/g.87946 Transcript_41268/m.87946 type:complete len:115 (-) Transcript_41268:31-375(-)